MQGVVMSQSVLIVSTRAGTERHKSEEDNQRARDMRRRLTFPAIDGSPPCGHGTGGAQRRGALACVPQKGRLLVEAASPWVASMDLWIFWSISE